MHRFRHHYETKYSIIMVYHLSESKKQCMIIATRITLSLFVVEDQQSNNMRSISTKLLL